MFLFSGLVMDAVCMYTGYEFLVHDWHVSDGASLCAGVGMLLARSVARINRVNARLFGPHWRAALLGECKVM